MDTLEAIHTRRSVRKFTGEPVPEDVIDKLLAAAMTAPSAGNAQPWEFVVIRDMQTLEAIDEFHHHARFAKDAGLAILVCADPKREKYEGRWILDCSAATENLLLAARALGLGACWCGLYPVEKRMAGARKLVNAPDHIQPVAIVPVGYTEAAQERKERYNPQYVHRDKW